MRIQNRTGMSALGCLLLVACGAPNKLMPGSETQSVIMPTRKVFDYKNIRLCFTGVRVANAERIVAAAIAREYHGKTPVRFVGFQGCTEADMLTTTIRFEFTSGSITCGNFSDLSILGCSFIGPTTDSLKNTHNASLIIRIPKSKPTDWTPREIRRIENSSLHELGHGIGLMHEHERDDSNAAAQCRSKFQTTSTLPNDQYRIVYVGKYDPQSIMNYCNGESGKLSPGDVQGIFKLYNIVSE